MDDERCARSAAGIDGRRRQWIPYSAEGLRRTVSNRSAPPDPLGCSIEIVFTAFGSRTVNVAPDSSRGTGMPSAETLGVPSDVTRRTESGSRTGSSQARAGRRPDRSVESQTVVQVRPVKTPL